ncbi:MAG TPA: general secretion pathway protein GspF [Chromatiales bacterium]|nr:general secretion pathway protein GspF [Chromatiales bacterium]
MAKKQKNLHPDAPLLHDDHPRPVSRRDFLRQGFISGTGMVLGGSVFSLFANPRAAQAALSSDIQTLADSSGCPVGTFSGGKIPVICFDLAGGASIAGSNVLVGGPGGQLDLLSTAGYSKLGLPGDMLPGQTEAAPSPTSNGDFTDGSFGLLFHSDSAFLRGMLEKTAPGTRANVDGALIPARSANDTANNPHNPMYGFARAGAGGEVVTLIGSQSSDSGGRSMAPASLIDLEIRPTKVDRPSDVTGMVDTGNLTGILDANDVVPVMESMARLADRKVALPSITGDAVIQDLIRCGYIGAADIADRFAGVDINPDDRNAANPVIVSDAGGIFTEAEFDGDREFRKTASVMKMVIDGYAGAGTIAMGGYDYHTGDRETGERRDLRAGRCMGACLEYAARVGVPLMLYVFSDGSLSSNGTIDNSVDGRGKGVWTGDNSSTAASMILYYDPAAKPDPIRRQIGYFSADGSAVTSSSPAANNVNLLVNTVVLNYMSINGDINQFATLFPNHGLGNLNNLIAF